MIGQSVHCRHVLISHSVLCQLVSTLPHRAVRHKDMLPLLICPVAPLLRCSAAPLLRCPAAPLLRCSAAPLPRCSAAPLPRCPAVPLPRHFGLRTAEDALRDNPQPSAVALKITQMDAILFRFQETREVILLPKEFLPPAHFQWKVLFVASSGILI